MCWLSLCNGHRYSGRENNLPTARRSRHLMARSGQVFAEFSCGWAFVVGRGEVGAHHKAAAQLPWLCKPLPSRKDLTRKKGWPGSLGSWPTG